MYQIADLQKTLAAKEASHRNTTQQLEQKKSEHKVGSDLMCSNEPLVTVKLQTTVEAMNQQRIMLESDIATLTQAKNALNGEVSKRWLANQGFH